MINNRILKIKKLLATYRQQRKGRSGSGNICARLSGEAAMGLSGEMGVHFPVFWKTY